MGIMHMPHTMLPRPPRPTSRHTPPARPVSYPALASARTAAAVGRCFH
jgi:hypothetical protein